MKILICLILMVSIFTGCSNNDSSSSSSIAESSSYSDYKTLDKFPSIFMPEVKENADGWVYYNVAMNVLEQNKNKEDIAKIIEKSKVDNTTVDVFEAYNVKTDTYAFSAKKDNEDVIMYVSENQVTFGKRSEEYKKLI